MTDDQGQLALAACAGHLLGHLASCEGRLRRLGGMEQLQHREFAQRSRLLAVYLEQSLRSGEAHAYPAAYALVRSALDHRIFDRLLFLGTVHEVVMKGVTDATWARWQVEKRPEHLHIWERLPKDRVRIVWRGPQVFDEAKRPVHQISIYYQWWREYDPFAVPAKDLREIASGSPSRTAQMAEYHELQREMWREALAWQHLKGNLILNGLATEREVVQLDVHYRFLSAFTHPFSQDVTDSVYGQRVHGAWPTAEHYAMELRLGYVCVIAIDELRDFERMTQREPRVDLDGWDAVIRDLARGEAHIAHLWMPGRPSYDYDRVNEANRRVSDAYDLQHAAGTPLTRPDIPDPRRLTDDEVRYYPDPLRRLVRVHSTTTEMTTGLTWQSPWPREDARFR